MYGIEIEDGKKIKCPNCNSIFAIENDEEILYRSITLLYINRNNNTGKVKCKQCKHIISIPDIDTKGRQIRAE
jgi:hypothetical protein